jgi:NADP-dependent 3-hydroxy acid dehydrogenase YdfG
VETAIRRDGALELTSVIIPGGSSGVANVFSRTLEMSTFDDVVIADMAIERAQKICRIIGSEKIRAEELDFGPL